MTFRAYSTHDIMNCNTTARGFSLIEVLIGIVVLGLGLLGLAAIFPAVVQQQRQALDTTQGISVERSAEEWIRGNQRLFEQSEPPAPGIFTNLDNASNRRGWERLTADSNWSYRGRWELPEASDGYAGITSGIGLDPTSGAMIIGPSDEANGLKVPLTQRLIPNPNSVDALGRAVQPRFVWDLALRRIDRGADSRIQDVTSLADDAVQIAIFVRRIDTGIRIPRGMRLVDTFRRDGDVPNYRVPVAADDRGRPTGDGVGTPGESPNYSQIQYLEFEALEEPGDGPTDPIRLIQIPETGPYRDTAPFARQVGQKFVDESGTVRTVVDIIPQDQGRPAALQIEPPINRADLAEWNGDATLELIFTPQVPASVKVITIRPGYVQ